MEKLKKRIHDDSNGLDYVLVGDYYIPDLQLPAEKLKASNQLAWVGHLNSIRHRAEKIILSGLVYGKNRYEIPH